MAKKTVLSRLHQPVHPVFALVLIGIAGIAVLSALVLRSSQNPTPPQQYQTQTTVTYAPPPQTDTSVLPTSSVKTFVSPDLGISFQYNVGYPNAPHPKEIGNIVYLYDGDVYPNGMYVQVLSKDSSQTLQDAVRNQFLQGYSTQKCLFRDNSGNTRSFPSSYIRLSVYPVASNQENDAVAKTDCPAYLIGQDGGSYFLMAPKHPNKFLFIHLTQGNPPGGKVTWDNTVQFLD